MKILKTVCLFLFPSMVFAINHIVTNHTAGYLGNQILAFSKATLVAEKNNWLFIPSPIRFFANSPKQFSLKRLNCRRLQKIIVKSPHELNKKHPLVLLFIADTR